MFKRLFILVFLVVLLIPALAQAQDDLSLAYLQVDLWPEYDRPEMLVILRAQLGVDVSLPAEVNFRIPAAAGVPNAVAVRQPDGALLNAMYEHQDDGKWNIITVTATTPEIQLEYYDPQLEKRGSERHFEFVWQGDYDVEAMLIQIQQPVGASGIAVEPDLGELISGTDGLQYYIMEVGAPAAGDTVSVKLDYQKDNDTLSSEAFQVQPNLPTAGVGGNRLAQVNLMSLLPWLLGGLGVLLVVGGLLWYWRSGQETQSPKQTSRGRRRSAALETQEQENSAEGVYCHQCGKRASRGDRFCRACGTRMRIEG